MFNDSEEVDMRAVFKSFKDKILENAANLNGSDEIEHAVKHAELVALNSTLDDIILEISVRKQEGAASKNITEKIKIFNLKDYLFKNAHGLYEI